LSDWGYNRDKKSGKKQVVLGLLCDESGDPVSIEVYRGNTLDFETFDGQIKKVVAKFGCQRVTLVGDRGMIKSGQITALGEAQFHYITAITKPQIEKLLREGVFQMELFDQPLCEVEQAGIRYVLRRNPERVKEIASTRQGKKESIEKFCDQANGYLTEHPRARAARQLKKVETKIEQLKVSSWLKVIAEGKRLELREDAAALAEEAKLDGCYVIKSDLPKEVTSQILHDRYKDLAHVEQAFRTCKTGLLEMRPWYVTKEESTRGHALEVMLAYLITHYLQQAWAGFNLTVEEGLAQLSLIVSTKMSIQGQENCHFITRPGSTSAQLLIAANVQLPQALPNLGARVVSRKQLQMSR
jgi:transposase